MGSRQGTAVILGGTSGIGRELASQLAADGMTVVISGRDAERAAAVAAEIGPNVSGFGVDLAQPETLREALAGITSVDHLVVAAIERDANSVKDYDIARATRLVVLKLVGYTEAIHVLMDRFTPEASIVLFGGMGLWAVLSMALINRSGPWMRPASGGMKRDGVLIVIALVMYGLITGIHMAFGYNPFLGNYA